MYQQPIVFYAIYAIYATHFFAEWIDKSETNCGHREWRNKYFKICDLVNSC